MGCGLLLNGTTQRIDIDTTPPRAQVSFNGVTGIAPANLTVRRRGWGVFKATKEGYQPACKVLPSSKNSLLVLLDSIPAAIPLAIDLITGAIHTFPDSIRCALPPVPEGATPRTLPSDEELLETAGYSSNPCEQEFRCDLEAWSALYRLTLVEVLRPVHQGRRYSQTISVPPSLPGGFLYGDSSIEITILPAFDGVDFRLRNLTEHAVKLVWDEAVFMDLDGTSNRVLHAGVRYAERNNAQVDSVVAPGGVLQDVIVPVNRVVFGVLGSIQETPGGASVVVLPPDSSTGGFARWYQLPLVDATFRGCEETEARFNSRVSRSIGSRFSVLLPLEVEGVVNEYTFVFGISDAELGYGLECVPPKGFLGEVQIRGRTW